MNIVFIHDNLKQILTVVPISFFARGSIVTVADLTKKHCDGIVTIVDLTKYKLQFV